MRRVMWLLVALALLAGCKTPDEPKSVSWERQQAYLGRVRDPRLFGLSIYQTSTGMQIRGGSRLHPSRTEVLDMLVENPWRSVVHIGGRSDQQIPAVIDLTVPNSRLEFDAALAMKTRPVSDTKAQLVTVAGDDTPYCLSLVPSIGLGQFFVENVLVGVRMNNGLPDGIERDVVEPRVRAVLGWDLFSKLGQVQFLHPTGKLVLKTEPGYEPNPSVLVAKMALMPNRDRCMVRGVLNGRTVPVLIDPAGDFEVAVPGGVAVATLALPGGLVVNNPSVQDSPGGVRIGARLLETYLLTICPTDGVIYFEAIPQLEQ